MTGPILLAGCVTVLLMSVGTAIVLNKEPCSNSLLTDELVVPDRLFSATSELMQDGSYHASRARMDNTYNIPWKAGKLDKKQYNQVDLGIPTLISAIRTQGCGIIGMCQEWVTKYRFVYSLDGQHWRTYGDSKTFQVTEFTGNSDSHRVVENTLSCPTIARYIRIIPVEWNNYISMKIDLLGCALNHAYLSSTSNGNPAANSTPAGQLNKPHPKLPGAGNSSSIPQPSQSLTIASSGGHARPLNYDCLGGLGKLSCWGVADGDYQHCVSCRKFIKCSNYNIFEFACPANLLWNYDMKECAYMSPTCSLSI